MTLGEAERGIRTRLDTWKFWVGVAYVGLIAVIVALFVIQRDLANEQARRTAAERAAAVGQVQQCRAQAESRPQLLSLVRAIRLNAANSATSLRGLLRLNPTGPSAELRRASLARARRSVNAADAFTRRLRENMPTDRECRALARRLHVAPDDTGAGSK